MRPSVHHNDKTDASQPLDDVVVEDLMAGRGKSRTGEVDPLSAFLDDVRSLGTRPAPPPSPTLARILAGGRATEGAANGPAWPTRRRPKTLIASGSLWSRWKGAGLAAKAALVTLVMAATLTVAGAARVLPGPAQQIVARALEALTPFEFSDDVDAPRPEEMDRQGNAVLPGIANPGDGQHGQASPPTEQPGGKGPPLVPPGTHRADERPAAESRGRNGRPVPPDRPPPPPGSDAAVQRTATLDGRGRGLGPGDRDGRGVATVTLYPDRGLLCLSLTVSGIAPVTSVHLHQATGSGVGPLASLVPTDILVPGCVPADGRVLDDLVRKPSHYYVEVHNVEFPGGALRGRLSR